MSAAMNCPGVDAGKKQTRKTGYATIEIAGEKHTKLTIVNRASMNFDHSICCSSTKPRRHGYGIDRLVCVHGTEYLQCAHYCREIEDMRSPSFESHGRRSGMRRMCVRRNQIHTALELTSGYMIGEVSSRDPVLLFRRGALGFRVARTFQIASRVSRLHHRRARPLHQQRWHLKLGKAK
jgi:hypothetical protein